MSINDNEKKWLEYCARTGLYQSQIGQNQLAQQHIANQQAQMVRQQNVELMGQQNNITMSTQSLQQFLNQPPVPPKPLTTGIHYKKISLFDAPAGAILVHACNAQGVWGSGIAKEFKSKFPKSFKEYNEYCKNNPSYYTDGTALITKLENDHQVGCLITSSNYGDKLNAEQTILINTKHALENLAQKCKETTFYSNKFNSGFFKVPWEHTEKLINDFVKKHNKIWIICDPNLKEEKK
jgi:ADP-ribose 1''-phosphate phosphatase